MSDPSHSEPLGRGRHVVRRGEDLYSIAWRHRVDPDEVWDHPDNAELRDGRQRHVLLPGDRIALPPSPPLSKHSISKGSTSKFTANVPRHEVRLKVKSGGADHPGDRYTAEVDGRRHEGTIDGSGHITIPVRPGSRHVKLTIHEEWETFTHDHEVHLDLGALDPVESPTGVQARLRNLGIPLGPVDGDIGERTRDAIKEFQRRHDLETTGEVDDATRDRLTQEQGH